jgi:hypothetical protein
MSDQLSEIDRAGVSPVPEITPSFQKTSSATADVTETIQIH